MNTLQVLHALARDIRAWLASRVLRLGVAGAFGLLAAVAGAAAAAVLGLIARNVN